MFDLLSVEEHLWFYAKLKGIPVEMRSQLIENAIKDLSLEEHRQKLSKDLSGGNKRKLQVAVCILGNP